MRPQFSSPNVIPVVPYRDGTDVSEPLAEAEKGRYLGIGAAAPVPTKTRVVILTDRSNEPDGQMSLVRFLTYANVFEVEGLIAATSCWRHNHPDVSTIHKVIDACGEAYGNLRRHAPGYPDPEELHRVTYAGVDGYGTEAAAGQLENKAIDHIIEVLDQEDPRPVWFCARGGGNSSEVRS